MSSPSIKIYPSSFSTILDKARLTVLFPAPVLPTTPTFYPPVISNDKSLRTNSVYGLYLSFKFFIDIRHYKLFILAYNFMKIL